MNKINHPLICDPRTAYLLQDGRFMVLGQKPYSMDGVQKQSAAVHQSIEKALEMMETHERSYLAAN